MFAGLLVAAGVAKGIAPQAASGALRGMGLPSSALFVRLLGLIEVAIGLTAIVTGSGPAALGLAASYVGFAGFVAIALTRNIPISSCGCFGKDDTPPTWAHFVFNLAGAATAGLAAANPIGNPSAWLAELNSLAVPYLILTSVTLFFSYILLAELPRTMALIKFEPVADNAGGGT